MVSLDVFAQEAVDQLFSLLLAPSKTPDMLWIAIPLLGTLLFMQLYFSRHNESLGWNTAFGNGVALMFVVFDISRRVFSSFPEPSPAFFLSAEYLPKTAVVLIVLAYALLVLSTNFFRLLPEKASFAISSYPVTIVLAYVAIALIYSGIEPTAATLPAIIMIYVIAFISVAVFMLFAGRAMERLFPTHAERMEDELKRHMKGMREGRI